MRIVSLDASLTEIVDYLGLADSLVGVSWACRLSASKDAVPPRVLTAKQDIDSVSPSASSPTAFDSLSQDLVDWNAISELKPDIILARPTLSSGESIEDFKAKRSTELQVGLGEFLGQRVTLCCIQPYRLEEVFESYVQVGKALDLAEKGRGLMQRTRSHMLDWINNFYERMRNKKTIVISSLDPLTIAGLWVPDMISLISGIGYVKPGTRGSMAVSWRDVAVFRPDTIVVAPQAMGLQESMRLFTKLESISEWEAMPAVKRGEVSFTDGVDHFYSFGPSIVDTMAILISAVAGLDSGYITKRDSYFKLRWLELQRHRLIEK